MITIKKISITDLSTDAIVNAANEHLQAGGGVCGAIFSAAGYDKLQAACDVFKHCDTGSAVITSGFDLKAKYVIHAVGPIWRGGQNGEPQALYNAYKRSLELAAENGCRSIGFPLISAGIYGYPLEDAWRQAIQACQDYENNAEHSIEIVFAVLDKRIIDTGLEILNELEHASSISFDQLLISGRKIDAVFFHLPQEPYGFLSNWYMSPFVLDGVHYSSMEQYIMYQKCVLFGDQATAKKVLLTDDPSEQQKLGKLCTGYINGVWAGARQAITVRGLLAKFSQNADLREQLINTKEAYLVECAHSDKIWACGIRLNESERFNATKWTGQNILGFALMVVREIIKKNHEVNNIRSVDKFRGCLIGGAAGDALGYAVEFMHENQIFSKYGNDGIAEYELKNGVAEISDDTQMTLFTANGLLFGTTRGMTRGIMGDYESYIQIMYQNWYRTQTETYPIQEDYLCSWLMNIPSLFSCRAPGNTCLSAIKRGADGSTANPINDSKGCGGVMRVAPIGLYFANKQQAFEISDKLGAEAAALTHGHDLGYIPAAALVHIIRALLEGSISLKDSVKDAIDAMRKAIYEFDSTDNFAIALQGKWGCGKTSILNMISNEIAANSDTTIIVKFNPWNFTDCNQLISQFFMNLSTELKKQSDNKAVKKGNKNEIGTEIGRVIDKYSYALEYAKYIPVVGKYLEIIPQLASSVGEAIKKDAKEKSNDIIYQKNELIEKLKASKSRIVIMIDDIDRLPNDQIKLIFQLVSSVAGFPNITYLLSYDKNIVVKALNDVQGENGEEYLEKIIQLSFDVPDAKLSKLYNLLIEKIKDNIKLSEGELESTYWHDVLYKCILPYINSARNINRFVNALSFSYPPVKNEVCFADMAVICSFQLFAHPIYEWIKNNKFTLVGGYDGRGIPQNDIEERRNEVIESFKNIYSGNIDDIISALSVVFPSFNNKVSHNSNFITTLALRKSKRIASDERFDVYLSLDLEDVKISDAEFKMSINEMNEPQLREYLSSLKYQNLLSDYKNELRLYSKEIDEDRIELLLSAFMFSSGRIIFDNQLTDYNDKFIDIYFLMELLKIISDENNRFLIIKSIISKSDFLSFQKLLHLAHIIELNYGRIVATEYQHQEKLITEEHLKELESVIINRIKEFAKITNIFYWQECYRALLLWEVINKESYKEYISEQVKSKTIVIILASLAIGEWSNSNNVYEYELHSMSYCNYLDFVDNETVLQYIDDERKKEEFWKLEERIIKKAIAFFIIKKEHNSSLINAKIVNEKYEEWALA